MLKSIIIFVTCGFFISAVNLDASELDDHVLAVAMSYAVATTAAKKCGEYKFESEAAERNFHSNQNLARLYATRVFMERYPGEDPLKYGKIGNDIENRMVKDFLESYGDGDCSEGMLQTFVSMFVHYSTLPRFDFPLPDLTNAEFREEVAVWVVRHIYPK